MKWSVVVLAIAFITWNTANPTTTSAYAQSGAMRKPVSRKAVGAYFPTLADQTDPNFDYLTSLNCGERAVDETSYTQYCGPCGGTAENPEPKWTTDSTLTVEFYEPGQETLVALDIRKIFNNNGKYEFKLCQTDSTYTTSHGCFTHHLTWGHTGSTTIRPSKVKGINTYSLKLPDGFSCEYCVLQWKWTDGENKPCYQGNGANCHVTISNCANIAIGTSDGSRLTNRPTPIYDSYTSLGSGSGTGSSGSNSNSGSNIGGGGIPGITIGTDIKPVNPTDTSTGIDTSGTPLEPPEKITAPVAVAGTAAVVGAIQGNKGLAIGLMTAAIAIALNDHFSSPDPQIGPYGQAGMSNPLTAGSEQNAFPWTDYAFYSGQNQVPFVSTVNPSTISNVPFSTPLSQSIIIPSQSSSQNFLTNAGSVNNVQFSSPISQSIITQPQFTSFSANPGSVNNLQFSSQFPQTTSSFITTSNAFNPLTGSTTSGMALPTFQGTVSGQQLPTVLTSQSSSFVPPLTQNAQSVFSGQSSSFAPTLGTSSVANNRVMRVNQAFPLASQQVGLSTGNTLQTMSSLPVGTGTMAQSSFVPLRAFDREPVIKREREPRYRNRIIPNNRPSGMANKQQTPQATSLGVNQSKFLPQRDQRVAASSAPSDSSDTNLGADYGIKDWKKMLAVKTRRAKDDCQCRSHLPVLAMYCMMKNGNREKCSQYPCYCKK